MTSVALVLSGGSSARFGGKLPKQYQCINGKQVIAYTIEALKASAGVDGIVIAAGVEYIDELRRTYNTEVAIGGETRNESLRNGLEYIKVRFPECEKVFINEAARPFITTDLVDNYFNLLGEYDAVITTQYITDSLGCEGIHVTDRTGYYLIQAPEAFLFPPLYRCFEAKSPITATNQQLPPECKIYRNFEFRNNFKITYPEDREIAEKLMRCSR